MRIRLPMMLAGWAALLVAAPALADEPIARFADPLCPGVAGLKPDAASTVFGRIRDNARAAGVRLAQDGDCSPNLIVAFVEDGQGFLQRLEASKPLMFAEMSVPERRALLAEEGPARVLHSTLVRSHEGMPVPRRENLEQVPQTGMWSAHSRIYTPTRRDIVSALVLFDAGEIGEFEMTQLADYASLRGLAPIAPPDRGEGASIAALFDEDAPAPELTATDKAFLAAIYEGPANLPSAARQAGIAEAVRRAS